LNRSKRFERLERLKRPRYPFSAVEEFRLHLTHLGKAQTVNKVEDLLKRRLHNLVVAADHAEAQNRALPEILVTTLCDGDIELVGYPCLDPSEHSPLFLEGVVLRKDKAQLQNAHNQGGRVGLRVFSSYRLSPAEARDASRPPGVGVMRRITGTRS